MLCFELILNSLHASITVQNATEWNQSVLANTGSLDVHSCFNVCSMIVSIVIIFLFINVIAYINFHYLLLLLSQDSKVRERGTCWQKKKKPLCNKKLNYFKIQKIVHFPSDFVSQLEKNSGALRTSIFPQGLFISNTIQYLSIENQVNCYVSQQMRLKEGQQLNKMFYFVRYFLISLLSISFHIFYKQMFFFNNARYQLLLIS